VAGLADKVRVTGGTCDPTTPDDAGRAPAPQLRREHDPPLHRWVEQYARFFGKSPEKLGPDHLRTYQAHLLKTRTLAPGTVENHVAALRFLYVRTLKRHEFREYIPYPRVPRKLPGILSKEEVARLINSGGTLFNRTLLMVLYGTGMRRTEAARLQLEDIDGQRHDYPRGERQGRQGSRFAFEPGVA